MRLWLLCVPTVVLLVGADDPEKDKKQLQGTWMVVSFQSGTKEVPEEQAKMMTLTIKDDTFTLGDGKKEEKGMVKLDPSKTPKSMDLIVKDGKETALFIYALDGDTLKLCWRKPGGERPKEFAAKDTDGYMVLKRKKE